MKMKSHTTDEEPPSLLSGEIIPKVTWQQVQEIVFGVFLKQHT